MLTRMGTGLVFALLSCITQLLVHIFASYDFLLIIQQILFGITCFLIFPTSLEFTVAQSPEYMRGMMVGLCYSSLGIGSIIAFMLLFLIKKWYYIITISCVFQLLVLIVFVILAKRYKYRVRENEVNIVQIVDDHYQRYMDHEDEY
uniref:Major facilitator superfamily (MFS) profile domain-containing protein n=1 Tax=Amphimedon queenslandica TaxID=400682 RepID=A0A1X7UCW7_AMPQE